MLTVNDLGNFARNVRPRATKRRAGYPGAGWEEEEKKKKKIPGTRFPEQKMRGNPSRVDRGTGFARTPMC
jgi:hypothetical protein